MMAGQPPRRDPDLPDLPADVPLLAAEQQLQSGRLITACVFVLVLLVTMVYGPIAAFLVESFPSQVRYTSVSLPYHIGNGYFGGFLPLIATAVVAAAQKHADLGEHSRRYMGLIFPISVAAITFVVGSFLLRETKDNSMDLTESNQIGYNPAIFGGLIGLSVVALVLADQLLMPQIDATNTSTLKVQTFFRVLAALVILVSVGFGLTRRGRRARRLRRAGRRLSRCVDVARSAYPRRLPRLRRCAPTRRRWRTTFCYSVSASVTDALLTRTGWAR